MTFPSSPRLRRASTMGAALAVVSVSLMACSSSPASPPRRPSANDVYQALLHTPIPSGTLPAGFQSRSGPIQGDTNDTDRAHRALGEVDFPLRGPDAADQIEMIVFPTPADAANNLANGLWQNVADHVNTGNEPASGFDVPTTIYHVKVVAQGSETGMKAFSHCVATVGNVLVAGTAGLAGNYEKGNPQNACALAHAGITHLAAVEQTAGNPAAIPSTTTANPSAAPNSQTISGTCADVLFVGVRGSNEDANADAGMGSTIYALYGDVQHTLPSGTNVLGKGLPYAADVLDASGVPQGVSALTSGLTTRASQCPREKVVIAGFSLGAHVVGDALDQFAHGGLPATLAAAVLLADPRFNPSDSAVDQGTFDPHYGPDTRRDPYPHVIAPRIRSYCLLGDPICQGFQQPGADKTHHGEYVPAQTCAAAAFIDGQLGVATKTC